MNPSVLDFNQFGGSSGWAAVRSFNVGDGVVVAASSQGFAFLGSVSLLTGDYVFGSNGGWAFGAEPNGAFVGVDGFNTTLTFTFSSDVSAVGGFLNYNPDLSGQATISALADSGNVLEAYDLDTAAPISTPGQVDAGAFREIYTGVADIRSFQISGQSIGIDDLTFTDTAVPEPATWGCLIVAAVVLGAFSRLFRS